MSTQKQSIETIGYVSPLYRRELIAICGIRRQGEQIKEATGKSLEKLIENTVRFHYELQEQAMSSVYHPDPNRGYPIDKICDLGFLSPKFSLNQNFT